MSGVALSLDFDGVERRGGLWRRTFRRLVRQPVTLVSLFVLAVVLGAGALAPVLEKGGWNIIDLSDRWHNHGPTIHGHLLGTDNIGRDVLARVLWGIHSSEQTAIVGGLAAMALAALAGLTTGYFGGWLDAVVTRVADLVTGFPVIVVLIAVFVWLRPVTIWDATVVFALALWPFGARVIRAQTVVVAAEEYVAAAQALGASNRRIVLRHLLPNAAGTIVVTLTALIGQILLIEATAEFFGYGVASIARPTLGNLIGEATISGIGPYNSVGLGWWVWASPMIALVLVLACVSLVGDGLDSALNPRG
jgi:ABC-type dipeptide/oligopeptide/nickel transport system permease subunit